MKSKDMKKSRSRTGAIKRKKKKKAPSPIRPAPEEKVRLLSSALESLRDSVYITDQEHKIIYANSAIEIVHGYKPEEVIGKKAYKFFEGISGNPRNLARLIEKEAKNGFWIGEILNRRKDGSIFPAQLIENTIFGKKGEVLGYIGIPRDISKYKQILGELHRKEKRFRDITDNALAMIWEVDPKGRYTYVSPVVEKILGYKPEQMLKKHFFDLFHPEDREKLKKEAFKVFANKQPFRAYVNRNRHKNGGTVWLSTSGVPILDNKGNLVGYRGADTDITERKQAEETLRESEEKYRMLIEMFPHTIAIFQDNKVRFANPAALEVFGCKKDELIERDILSLVADQEKDRLLEYVRARLRGKLDVPEHYFTILKKLNGEEFPAEIFVKMITFQGRPAQQLAIFDLTESKQAEEAIKESESRYRTTIDSMGDPMHVVDSDLRILLINRALKQRLKELDLKQEVIGKRVIEVFPFLPARVFQEYEQVFETGKTLVTEESGRFGKREVVSETRKIPVIDKGKVIRVITVIRDITERKQAEERLREASKLEAVGTLSLGLAHEFNNILMGISGYTQLALADLDDRLIVRKAFNTILRQSERGRTLIRRLSTFGRREKPQSTPVDLTGIIDEAVALQKRELMLADIRIRRIYRQPSCVLADYSQMEQVFFNLIMNARQALIAQGQGTITLRVEDKKGMVEASVSDNGCGIAGDELDKIFLPFFTTKERESRREVPSLGLGLWVCKQIVEEHGGEIGVKSEEGKGTTFSVILPHTEKADAAAIKGGKEEAKVDKLSGRRVLVVDDEPDLVEMYGEYLKNKGVRVTETLRGEEALRLCRKEKYDTIILDYVMPGLSGKELCAEIIKASPESRIVVISGRPVPESDKKRFPHQVSAWLSKPVELKKLDRFVVGG